MSDKLKKNAARSSAAMTKKTWSYWERDLIPSKQELIVVGAGFTGLSAAIHAKMNHPKWKVLVLERAVYAEGASTKNAGFACYGTLGEIQADIGTMGRDLAFSLLRQRLEGLRFLKDLVGSANMDFQVLGGTELFLKGEEEAAQNANGIMEHVNDEFIDLNQGAPLFQRRAVQKSFSNIIQAVYSPLEAQLHPAKALSVLELKAEDLGITILKGVEVKAQEGLKDYWRLRTSAGSWQCKKLLYCTNAFGINGTSLDISPARNQVLITKAFNHGLNAGNYHAQEGYIYFRTVKDRLLIGGARHLDAENETTNELGLNQFLQSHLQDFLDQHLNLKGRYEIDQQWSGIIATAKSKEPIVEELESNLWYCGRFGGMGVALSAITGKRAADLLDGN
ncbi:MAG: FAD-binding oxidoreductase [Bacteroidetes bacterium]|nr:FAD-binding oxidoreductase [Bacteroidota bacterium]